ncbi:hypothetical protein EON77_19150 [bacterium]|nr:MAG: hypothetical protein EON77_19150 [bacterium]
MKRLTQVGSSGVKAAYVACGEAEIYAHPGRAGMLWDVCAPDAIVTAAGGRLTDALGLRYDFRRTELRCTNGVLATNGLLHDAFLGTLAKLHEEGAEAERAVRQAGEPRVPVVPSKPSE